jgi:2-keto-4-pentenoate hydratase
VQRQLGISEPVIGFLVSGGMLEPGASHSLAGRTRVGVESEIAVRVGRDVPPDADHQPASEAITSLAPAIEVVDIDLPFEDVAQILGRNVFHRAVALGPAAPGHLAELDRVRARVLRNGSEEAESEHEPADDLVEMVRLVARLLGRFGERLVAGDWIITGSLTPIVWVEPGDRAEVNVDPLGALDLAFTD